MFVVVIAVVTQLFYVDDPGDDADGQETCDEMKGSSRMPIRDEGGGGGGGGGGR